MSRGSKKRVRFKRQKKYKYGRNRHSMRHRHHFDFTKTPNYPGTSNRHMEGGRCKRSRHKHCSKHRPRFNLSHCCCFQCPPCSERTSTDKLILRYLKNLHKLHNEEQWKTALSKPKGLQDNSADHFKNLNSQKHLEERVNKNVSKPSRPEAGKYFAEVKKIPHAEKKTKKEIAVQRIIAHTLKYGVQKGILEKCGYVFKVCRPYRSCIDLANRERRHKSRSRPPKKYKSDNVVLYPKKRTNNCRENKHAQTSRHKSNVSNKKPHCAKRKKYYVRSVPSLTNSLKSSRSSSTKSLSEYKPLNYQQKACQKTTHPHSSRMKSCDGKSGKKCDQNWANTHEAEKWRRILKRHRLKYMKKKKLAKQHQDEYRRRYNDKYNSKHPHKHYSIETLYKSRSRTLKPKTPPSIKVSSDKKIKSHMEVTNSFDEKWVNENYQEREPSCATSDLEKKIHKVDRVDLKYLDPVYDEKTRHKNRNDAIRFSVAMKKYKPKNKTPPRRKETPCRKMKYSEPSNCSIVEKEKPEHQKSSELRCQQSYDSDEEELKSEHKISPERKRKRQSPASNSTDSGECKGFCAKTPRKKSPERKRCVCRRSTSKRASRRRRPPRVKHWRNRGGSDSRSQTSMSNARSQHSRFRAGSSTTNSTCSRTKRRHRPVYREKSVGTTFSNKNVRGRSKSHGFSIIEYIKKKYLNSFLPLRKSRKKRRYRYWRSRSSTRSRNRYENPRSNSVIVESVQVKRKINPRSKSTGYIKKCLSRRSLRNLKNRNFNNYSKFKAYYDDSKSQLRDASVDSFMSLIRNIKETKKYSTMSSQNLQRRRHFYKRKRRRYRSSSLRKRKRSYRHSNDNCCRKKRKLDACSVCKLKFKNKNKKYYNK